MKYQIRREPNSFDRKLSMYHVYDAARHEPGTAKGYCAGFLTQQEAVDWVHGQRTAPFSELVAEIEV
jgi:hypothetical protein